MPVPEEFVKKRTEVTISKAALKDLNCRGCGAPMDSKNFRGRLRQVRVLPGNVFSLDVAGSSAGHRHPGAGRSNAARSGPGDRAVGTRHPRTRGGRLRRARDRLYKEDPVQVGRKNIHSKGLLSTLKRTTVGGLPFFMAEFTGPGHACFSRDGVGEVKIGSS